jgi:predicted transcriptional regulator
MTISLRVTEEIKSSLQAIAEKTGKTKTELILDALNEKYHLKKNQRELIYSLAGWMTKKECSELRKNIAEFEKINEGDWQ